MIDILYYHGSVTLDEIRVVYKYRNLYYSVYNDGDCYIYCYDPTKPENYYNESLSDEEVKLFDKLYDLYKGEEL